MGSQSTSRRDGALSSAVLLGDDSEVLRLAERFRARDRELYLVGGSVRDLALRRAHVDLDFATDAVPEETLAVVEPVAEAVWLQGIDFGTVGCRVAGVNMEITTFRSERYESDSRHPDVTFEATIETDLSRRDFTINAMGIRLPEREHVDPFGGMRDLERRLLRTPISPRASFTDDPLRMLRAFRFASQLRFDIDASVLDAVRELAHLMTTVSAERVRDELSRLLVGDRPGRALELADESRLTELILPELAALKLEQDPVHRHKDVFHHTLAVVERTPQDLELRLAALLHDIGKPKTRRFTDEGVTFHHHEVEGAKMARARLHALRYRNEVVDNVSNLIFLHHRFHTYRLGWTDSAVRRYVRDAGPLLEKLNRLVRADCTTRNPQKARRLAARMDELEERIEELRTKEELERIRPDLDGVQVMAYLGVEPGRIVGEALDYLLEIRMEEGPIGEELAFARLEEWARARGLDPAGRRVPPKEKEGHE